MSAVDAAAISPEDIHGRPTAHEELWCLDTDGLPISREMSPHEATEWGELLSDVDDWQREALAAWVASGDYVAQGHGDLPSLPDFEEHYAGEWPSFRDYAENFADEIGLLNGVPNALSTYFDWPAWTRDLAYDFVMVPSGTGGVYVFRSL